MSFIAVLLALLIEQLRPLPQGNPVYDAMIGWARTIGRNFDAGREHHAWVVWVITVIVPAALAALVYWLLAPVSVLLALGWNLVMLYLTLGFRQFSHYFTDIREALEQGDEARARELLAQWRHLDASDLPRSEILRHVLEHSIVAAHRHVFGVFFWFVLGATLGLGPFGAVAYRLAEFAERYWAYKGGVLGVPSNERLMRRAQMMFSLMDHVPARLSAFGFAVVGNFEEAVECWRRQANLWTQPNDGILLAAAAGAMGVSLGGAAAPSVSPEPSKTFSAGAAAGVAGVGGAAGSTSGVEPQLNHLRTAVGLVWRSVVFWMLLLAMLTLARLAG